VTREEPHSPGEAFFDLGDEARLADPRLTRDRDHPPPCSEQPFEDFRQCGEFRYASDERRFRVCGSRRADPRHAEGGHRLALSLELEISQFLELEDFVDLARRRRSHDELAECLQARRHVDRVSERVVEDVRRRVTGRKDDRAGVDGHARAQLESVGGRDLRGIVAERFVNRERGANGALGVVLVRDRSAKERQDAIPGELRERAAEALDLLAHQAHDVVEQELRPLGAELLGDGRRAGDVGHEHRDHPPLSGVRRHAQSYTPGDAGAAVMASSMRRRHVLQ
jgi:hypothetical protein